MFGEKHVYILIKFLRQFSKNKDQLDLFVLFFFKNFNDFQITPEVGYCYFLNKTVTLEPSIYYDMSLSSFSKKSKLGLRVGIGLYF